MPAEPTAKAAPRLFSKLPLQVLLVTKSNTVMAPGEAGKVSVKAALVRAVGLLLLRVICSVELPVLGKIGLVKNVLLMVGRANTVMLASAEVPLEAGPATVKPSAGMVLFFKPMVVPVMVAITVHEPLAGMVPPLNATVVPPAVLVPTQVPKGADDVRPAGRVSLKAAAVMATAVGLLRVMVKVAVLPSGMVAALKALLMEGRATFRVALVATALLPMLEATAPAAIVLV
jgi:hypothetical protein